MTTLSPAPLCVIVKNGDGEQVKCNVIEWPIYNPLQLMPDMRVTGRVNETRKAIMPQTGQFFIKVPS